MSGLLLIDKNPGLTSHDVVARARRILATRKVGHAGTLDPLATGLLILGIGSSTRLLTYLVGLDKAYDATIRLGYATTTDDSHGRVTTTATRSAITAMTPERIAAGVADLTGHIRQVPSTVSAIKVDGTRAYARARAGEDIVLPARPVTIRAFEIRDVRRLTAEMANPVIDVDAHVECSSGTYVRALARDLGTSLGIGGHVTALRRTRIGPFRVGTARDIDHGDLASALVSPAHAASHVFRQLTLTDRQADDLGHGKRVRLGDNFAPVDLTPGSRATQSVSNDASGERLAALAPDGRLIGLVTVHGNDAVVDVNFPQ